MYQTHKTYITAVMKMSGLVSENPLLLYLLEHLDIDLNVSDKTVEQLCRENEVDIQVFLIMANLYNGFVPGDRETDSVTHIPTIIKFLKNSHNFYKNDKYPEIKGYIGKLHEQNHSLDIQLIERFFDDYFEEVLEHFSYEDEAAFPYFASVGTGNPNPGRFSVNNYKDHHTDIESKLGDLRNLLLKHIRLNDPLNIRRKILLSLFELEFDLSIHSKIEELILSPLVARMEKGRAQ